MGNENDKGKPEKFDYAGFEQEALKELKAGKPLEGKEGGRSEGVSKR